MGFKEKSAWIVMLGMVAVFVWYGSKVLTQGGFGGGTTAVMVGTVVWFIILVVIGHIVTAILQAMATGKNEVDDTADERDKHISVYGERAGGLILGLAVLGIIAFCLFGGQYFIASLLFLSMVLSEIVKNAWQIVLYRRSA